METKKYHLMMENTIKEIENLERSLITVRTMEVDAIEASLKNHSEILKERLELLTDVESTPAKTMRELFIKLDLKRRMKKRIKKLRRDWCWYYKEWNKNEDCKTVREIEKTIQEKKELLADINKVYLGRMDIVDLLKAYGKDIDGDVIGGVSVSI